VKKLNKINNLTLEYGTRLREIPEYRLMSSEGESRVGMVWIGIWKQKGHKERCSKWESVIAI